MIEDSHRVSQVFDSIRALFGKADQGTHAPVDINAAALESLNTLRGELKDHDIATRVELTPGLPLVTGHKGQLQEVVTNLVQNAIEAMDAIKDDPRLLKVRTRRDGGNAIAMEVEDSGPGIDPNQLDTIFDAFVTTKSKGMGLGLAICRMIIEHHGGEIAVSNAHPRGASFRIVLPQRGLH